MFSDYKAQMEQILRNTEKEESNNTQEKIAAVAMYKIMVGVINKFVEQESVRDQEFDAALSLDWKSAGRMLKYIWSNAEKMALRHGPAASCCLAEEVVFAWVREYYFLDDKETVMKERAERAKAEQQRKDAKAKEAQYRKKALEALKKQSGWDNLPDEEKKKKITAKIKSLKASDSRKAKEMAEKNTASDNKTAKDSVVPLGADEKTDTAPDKPQNNDSVMCCTENSVELEMEFAETLDGQVNLFNLMQGGGYCEK
ncbi:MAG: PcfK-like family protein [Lachnospiraceae bacterium]|nr:PcfK-like family protein [Lachnospiraceae bacterium]